MKYPAWLAPLPGATLFERIIRALSAVCLAIVFIGFCLALVIGAADTSRLLSRFANVSLSEVQVELSRKDVNLDEQIESLRGLFKDFNDEQWDQARALFASWVNDYGVLREDKLEFVSDLKRIGESFPPEQRAAAMDAYNRLKQEKLVKRDAGPGRWLAQIKTVDTLFWTLLLIGIFSITALLAGFVRSSRSDRGG
jgi:ribosomal protein L16 Arg81 hydroxylase